MGGDETWEEEIINKMMEKQHDELMSLSSDPSEWKNVNVVLLIKLIREMRAYGLNQACRILLDAHSEVKLEDVVLIAARRISNLSLEIMNPHEAP